MGVLAECYLGVRCVTMWCMAVRQVNLRLDEGLLARIDRERGLVPRNAWIVSRLVGSDPVGQAFVEPIVHQLEDPPCGYRAESRASCGGFRGASRAFSCRHSVSAYG